MCGIAGWYRRQGRAVAEAVIAAQCDQIRHRGPDDAGYLTDGDFGFGMRRLSIIDLPGGHQPITSAEHPYSIVFNGEIYNHRELRTELEGCGVRFRTQSDTETLLAAYVRWGPAAWLRLDGMYAVAIWNHRTRRLTLARDPLGIKPLYVTQQHGGLAFASELFALKPLPGHHFAPSDRAVHDFFSFGHIQKPRSIYEGVELLGGGQVLELGPSGGPEVETFWRPTFRPLSGRSEQSWIEETREQVASTVQRHMLADVPVGVFLSGGVDSGAIAAAMAQASPQPIKAFTLGLPGAATDETEAAARVAQRLGCEHVVLPLPAMDAAELLPEVQASFDEPTAANSAVPLWTLSKLAAEHVKVVLCGEGGDELFLGYKRQRTAERIRRARGFIRPAAAAARLLDAWPGCLPKRINQLRETVRDLGEAAALDTGFQRFFSATDISGPALRRRLYQPEFWLRQAEGHDYGALEAEYFPGLNANGWRHLEQFEIADLTVHMPASLLFRLDRASMAHSLEARVPFLSHRFVDWALTVPTELKLKGGTTKHVLREAARPWLPEDVVEGRKLGFQLPFARWFEGESFNDFARESWRASGAADAGYVRPQVVEDLFDEHRRGEANHGRLLYALTMFGLWWARDTAPSGRSPP
jgi:asparagine synthase (glutamine-hydrolysing)